MLRSRSTRIVATVNAQSPNLEAAPPLRDRVPAAEASETPTLVRPDASEKGGDADADMVVDEFTRQARKRHRTKTIARATHDPYVTSCV